MTNRQQLVKYLGYQLYKAGIEYATANGTAEGFAPEKIVAELVSDGIRKNLAVTANAETYNWPRLVKDVRAEAKNNLRLLGR